MLEAELLDTDTRVPVTGCTGPSLDCVPVIMRGVSTRLESYACDLACARSFREYDIRFEGRPSGWSQPVP